MAGVTQLLVISAVLIALAFAVPATAWAVVILALIRRIPVPAVEDREKYGTAAPRKGVRQGEGRPRSQQATQTLWVPPDAESPRSTNPRVYVSSVCNKP